MLASCPDSLLLVRLISVILGDPWENPWDSMVYAAVL